MENIRKPILPNFCIYYRDMGATGCANAWIVRPDGSLREPVLFQQRKNYPEGWKHWSCADQDDLVLLWEKGCTAEPHRLEVRHRPVVITQEQRDFADQLWPTLDERWEGAVGLASKVPAPPLTKGWDLDAGQTAPVVPHQALMSAEARRFAFEGAELDGEDGSVWVQVYATWTAGLDRNGKWRPASDGEEYVSNFRISNRPGFYDPEDWPERLQAIREAVQDGLDVAAIVRQAVKIPDEIKAAIVAAVTEVTK